MSFFHQLTGPLYPLLDWPMNTGPNGGYNFFSGIFGGSAFLSVIGVYARHHNCRRKRCWRLGHPDPDGQPVCKKHREGADQ